MNQWSTPAHSRIPVGSHILQNTGWSTSIKPARPTGSPNTTPSPTMPTGNPNMTYQFTSSVSTRHHAPAQYITSQDPRSVGQFVNLSTSTTLATSLQAGQRQRSRSKHTLQGTAKPTPVSYMVPVGMNSLQGVPTMLQPIGQLPNIPGIISSDVKIAQGISKNQKNVFIIVTSAEGITTCMPGMVVPSYTRNTTSSMVGQAGQVIDVQLGKTHHTDGAKSTGPKQVYPEACVLNNNAKFPESNAALPTSKTYTRSFLTRDMKTQVSTQSKEMQSTPEPFAPSNIKLLTASAGQQETIPITKSDEMTGSSGKPDKAIHVTHKADNKSTIPVTVTLTEGSGTENATASSQSVKCKFTQVEHCAQTSTVTDNLPKIQWVQPVSDHLKQAVSQTSAQKTSRLITEQGPCNPINIPIIYPSGGDLRNGKFIPILCKIQKAPFVGNTQGQSGAIGQLAEDPLGNKSGRVMVQGFNAREVPVRIPSVTTCTTITQSESPSEVDKSSCTYGSGNVSINPNLMLSTNTVIPPRKLMAEEMKTGSSGWKIIGGNLQKRADTIGEVSSSVPVIAQEKTLPSVTFAASSTSVEPISSMAETKTRTRHVKKKKKSRTAKQIHIQHALPNITIEPSCAVTEGSLPKLTSLLNTAQQSVSLKRNVLSKIGHLHSNARVPRIQVCISPTPDDKIFVQEFLQNNSDIIGPLFGDINRVAYSYETEGLVVAPGIVLNKSEHDQRNLGAMMDVCTTPATTDCSEQLPAGEDRAVDAFVISGHSLKKHPNVRLHMDPADLEIFQASQKSIESTDDGLCPPSSCSNGTAADDGTNQNHQIADGNVMSEDAIEASVSSTRDEIVALKVESECELDPRNKTSNQDITASEDPKVSSEDQPKVNCSSEETDVESPITHEGLKALISGTDHFDEDSVDIEGVEEVSDIDILDGIPFVSGSEVELPSRGASVTVYACYMCNYCSITEEKLVDHWVNVHVPQKPYLCSICKKAAFSTSFRLLKHISVHHPEHHKCLPITFKKSAMYQNPLVMVISEEDSISDHLVSLHKTSTSSSCSCTNCVQPISLGTIFCNSCLFECDSPMAMREHQREKHTKSYSYGCASCKKAFRCRFDLVRHRQLHHSVQNYHDEACQLGTEISRKVVEVMGCTVPWDEGCKEVYRSDSKTPSYTCLLCPQEKGTIVESAKAMWDHLTAVHVWPQYVTCNSCSTKIVLLDVERASKRTCCPPCSRGISLVPRITEMNIHNQMVFICRICDYKTVERAAMHRHVKFNYTRFKPYACGHCPYMAVEKSKVKKHIYSMHSSQKITVKEVNESLHDVRIKADFLMSRLTLSLLYKDLELYLGEDEELHHSTGEIMQNNILISQGKHLIKEFHSTDYEGTIVSAETLGAFYGNGPHYPCEDCDFLAMSWRTYSRHRRQAHMDYTTPHSELNSRVQKRHMEPPPEYSHFRCSICGYCCVDRSSMSRHIKYMHMHERPHGCPYCGYKNVEKTKVRLHVLCCHPKKPTYVKTNYLLLQEMSSNVKGYYTRVDHNTQGNPLANGRTRTAKRKGETLMVSSSPKKRRKHDVRIPTTQATQTKPNQHVLGTRMYEDVPSRTYNPLNDTFQDVIIKQEPESDEDTKMVTASPCSPAEKSLGWSAEAEIANGQRVLDAVSGNANNKSSDDNDQEDVNWALETIDDDSEDFSDENDTDREEIMSENTSLTCK